MVCLDTDFLVDLLRLKKEAWAELEELRRDRIELSTTPINCCELFKGAFPADSGNVAVHGIGAMIESLRILDIDRKSCETFGRLSNEMQGKGSSIADFDLLIASVAMAHGESLMTRNKKHFEKVPGLVVETW
jgi:tRNA(fMet)-specific endonuclease VapC